MNENGRPQGGTNEKKNKKTLKKVLIAVACVAAAVLLFVSGFFASRLFMDKGLRSLLWFKERIQSEYYEEISDEEFWDAAIEGVDIGEFEHRTLRTENNTGRCYLKPHTNERGDFLLTSYYVGTQASHSIIKVSIGDVYKETLPAEPSDINSYTDLGQFHETIILPTEKLNGIPQFIAENSGEKIRITLEGEKGGSYSYYLNKTEKAIFLDTYRLSALLSEINGLNSQYNKASKKASYLKSKLDIRP